MCSQMTDLALAGKCGCFGACGSSSSAAQAALSGRPRPPRAAAPRPRPAWPRKSRREEWLMGISVKKGGSEAVQEVVGVRQRVHEVDEGGGVRGLWVVLRAVV